jgi:membrane protease YdiL (CAAX protease family)
MENMPGGGVFWWVIAQLFLGIWCIFYRWFYPTPRPSLSRPIMWQTSSLNFAIFLWFSGMFIFGLFPLPLLEGRYAPYVLGFLSQGILFLLLLSCCRRNIFNYHIGLQPNPLALPQLIKTTAFAYLCLTPPLFFLSALWGLVLLWMQRVGLPVSIEQQELLLLLGNNPSLAFTLLVTLTAVVVAPTCEELLFRGGVYRFLKGHMSPLLSALLTSGGFALLHWNAVAFFPLFCLSMFLIRIYEREGSITSIIIIHGLFNLNSIVVTLLEASIGK